ncbi:lipid-binding SYLF domain-containing protein [Robiginitalea aurantiaca]|uniref:Lipid-binding SYLF domain-containing protein n=1 Tax=Robiginitalea aurantiaca TaxID=3056915 RepID=A0ABT7WCN5_9FLAO|nr:lipid-binding SYLF domain-containing protein [Robiginitalea aurantiaca]MDM9630680.1 lipid-binding SYLF domain-containing protein [Robiginitalea aurantiaca]
MKKIKFVITLLLVGSIGLTASAQSKKDQKIIEDAKAAVATLTKENPDLKNFFNKSAGAAVFPNVGKGGFIVGGASGNGVLYENGKIVGMTSLKELTVGFQAGGEAITEVVFFETQADVDKFKEENFEFGAGVSATALKSGASLNKEFSDGVAVFTYTKGGLMGDVSVGGQKFKYDPF